MELFSTLALCSYYIVYIFVSENLILFSIRLEFHLGPGSNLSYIPTSYSILYATETSVLFKLDNASLRKHEFKKDILPTKRRKNNVGVATTFYLINLIKIKCYTF